MTSTTDECPLCTIYGAHARSGTNWFRCAHCATSWGTRQASEDDSPPQARHRSVA
ncbi:hypothetical protein [Salinibacterium amurskyense]|uniref:hypothetical protein n=1 Tax=Salinibacterium amurskyense TaxID=205941 RepID=UPI00131488C3|nr:hypothetical protein [Salinibacterium amurskyense]